MSDETKADSASRPPQPSSPQLNDAADVRQPRAGNRGGCSTVGDSPRRDDEQRESPTVSESLPSRLSTREFWEQRVVNLEPVFIPRSEAAFAFAEAYALAQSAELRKEVDELKSELESELELSNSRAERFIEQKEIAIKLEAELQQVRRELEQSHNLTCNHPHQKVGGAGCNCRVEARETVNTWEAAEQRLQQGIAECEEYIHAYPEDVFTHINKPAECENGDCRIGSMAIHVANRIKQILEQALPSAPEKSK